MSDDSQAVRPRRRNTKERIIDEAELLAAQHGIEHLKLQDVADRIGIKLPSVYAHFSGREDILAAMGARIHNAFAGFYHRNAEESAIEALVRSVRGITAFLVEHPAYFRLLLRDLSVPLGFDAVHRRYSVNAVNPLPVDIANMLARIDHLLDAAVQEEEARKVSALDFFTAVHGALLLRLSMDSMLPPNESPGATPESDDLANAIQSVALALLGRKRI